MCEGMSEMILSLYILILTILIGVPIVSTIAFIYMARFKGKMILASALFISIFGTLPAIAIWTILPYVPNTGSIIINGLISLFILLSSTFVLYSVLGYACRKWRIKNNIPSNRVLEKDVLVITMILLICNIIYIIYIYI